jgi:hypothetical protein
MTRRLLHLLVALSSVLAMAVGAFWWRSDNTYEAFFLTSSSDVLWEFSSGGGLAVQCVRQWPGPFHHWYGGYNCRDGSNMTPESMPCLIYQSWGGAWHQSGSFWGVFYDHGAACSPVRPSGAIWLGPPYPNEGRVGSWTLSKPMPFWCVATPYGIAVGVFATPAAVLMTITIFRWFRNRRRISQSLCSKCGYDLRATRDRCPECGKRVSATQVG